MYPFQRRDRAREINRSFRSAAASVNKDGLDSVDHLSAIEVICFHISLVGA